MNTTRFHAQLILNSTVGESNVVNVSLGLIDLFGQAFHVLLHGSICLGRHP